jgi:replicative DNA helicase
MVKKSRENEDFVISSEYSALHLCIHAPAITDFSRDDFPHEEAQDLFEAIKLLRDREESITEASLFREANSLNDSVDSSLVKIIFNYKTDLSSLPEVLKVLKESSTKYKLKKQAEEIVERTSTADPLDQTSLSKILYEAQDTLINGTKKVIAKTAEQCLDEYSEELENRLTGKAYSFADIHLDEVLLRKAAPKQIILVVGSTGTGKSAFALNIINGMVNNNLPVIYFSLEMDTISTFDRLLAMRTGIPTEEWYNKESIPSLKKKLEKEREALSKKPFRFIDDASLGLDQMQSIIKEFKMTYKTDYACVFVDLVTQVKDFTNLKGQGTLANTIEFSVNRLNSIAKSENICVVCIAQLNRETDSAKLSSIDEIDNYRPSLNQVKNSHALGERSRTVVSVFRPKYYAERLFPDDETLDLMEDILEIQVLKQSQGVVGKIKKYMFDGPCFSLKPFIEEEEEGING